MAINAEVYEADRKLLWGLCYRMTGNAADADDLVQETFVRALKRPPRDTSLDWRPWLVRVAINLSRDLLRRRRRTGYTGPWLPSPLPTAEESPASYEPSAPSQESPAAHYDLIESVSFAFLLALEALTPSQRAVLLLRDVFDYTTEEAADALDMTESNVKVMLHRARQKMKDYDKSRLPSGPSRSEATRQALEQFLLYLSSRNVEGLERLLAKDVVAISDGGGEVRAALNVVRGSDRVIRLILGLADKGGIPRFSYTTLNGLPAIVCKTNIDRPQVARRFTLQLELDAEGRVRQINTVLSPRKLTAIS
jgi:RNA polymerase sigma-70 factor (ECF subfamily)